MNRWIRLHDRYGTPWHDILKHDLHLVRTDCVDTEWFHLDTGARIILASDGGWREADPNHPEDGPSRFRVFHMMPGGAPVELTSSLLSSSSQGEYDRTQTGSDTFTTVLRNCQQQIDNALQPLNL